MTTTMVVVIKTLMKLLNYFKIPVVCSLLVGDLIPQFYFRWSLPGEPVCNWCTGVEGGRAYDA